MVPLPGMGPSAQTLSVTVNSGALRNLSPEELQALAKATVNVPIAEVRKTQMGSRRSRPLG